MTGPPHTGGVSLAHMDRADPIYNHKLSPPAVSDKLTIPNQPSNNSLDTIDTGDEEDSTGPLNHKTAPTTAATAIAAPTKPSRMGTLRRIRSSSPSQTRAGLSSSNAQGPDKRSDGTLVPDMRLPSPPPRSSFSRFLSLFNCCASDSKMNNTSDLAKESDDAPRPTTDIPANRSVEPVPTRSHDRQPSLDLTDQANRPPPNFNNTPSKQSLRDTPTDPPPPTHPSKPAQDDPSALPSLPQLPKAPSPPALVLPSDQPSQNSSSMHAASGEHHTSPTGPLPGDDHNDPLVTPLIHEPVHPDDPTADRTPDQQREDEHREISNSRRNSTAPAPQQSQESVAGHPQDAKAANHSSPSVHQVPQSSYSAYADHSAAVSPTVNSPTRALGADLRKPGLLSPQLPHLHGRKCLVLDLDETLVHSTFKVRFVFCWSIFFSFQFVSSLTLLLQDKPEDDPSQPDFAIPVEIEGQVHYVYVRKRPGVDHFLKRMGEIYEVVIFTASVSKV